MIIGIDASRANRDHKTGTEWYSYYLIRWLAKLDDKNEYILYTDKPLKGGLLDLSTKVHFSYYKDREIKYDEDGYQILRSPFKNFKAKVLNWPFSNFWTIGRLSWEMVLHKPDVLFVPAHVLPLIIPKKTVNTIHDVAFVRDASVYENEIGRGEKISFSGRLLNYLVRFVTLGKYNASKIDHLLWSTKYSLRRAKKVITVSNFSKQEIVENFKADPNKIEVIHNGYSKTHYRKIDDEKLVAEMLNKYNIERPYIFYIGRLERKKNVVNLIEGFSLAKENKQIKEKLVLVGDASFGYDEINYAIREFGLENCVIMPGWVKEEDVPYIFAGASAFIFPSKHEGFGIPVVEAMASGIPVACSDIPVLKEVGGEAAYYFNSNDPKEVSQAIEKIILDNNLRKEMVEKGLRQAEKYSWQKTAEKTLALLNNL